MNLENDNTRPMGSSDGKHEERRLASLYGPPSLRDEISGEALIESVEETEPVSAQTSERSEPIFNSETERRDPTLSAIELSYEMAEKGPKTLEQSPEDSKAEEYDNSVLAGVARGFLLFFSPILMPLYVTLLLFELSMMSLVGFEVKLSLTLIVFGICSLLPFLLIMVLKRAGFIKDYQLTERQERTLPYSFMFFALGGTALFFAVKGAPSWMWFIYIGGATSVLLNLLINFKWKICCHATAAGALVAAIMIMQTSGLPPFDLVWWEIGSILFAGVIGSACLIVRTHTLLQVLCGYATGFLSVILYSV